MHLKNYPYLLIFLFIFSKSNNIGENMTGKCIYKNITKPEINFVLISLCTCKRPKMLKNALKSIENIICHNKFFIYGMACQQPKTML